MESIRETTKLADPQGLGCDNVLPSQRKGPSEEEDESAPEKNTEAWSIGHLGASRDPVAWCRITIQTTLLTIEVGGRYTRGTP